MISNPDISVLIPVHNSEKTISRAIKSILDQTFQNFELLIIENGSSDNTTEIISKHNDERIIHKSLREKSIVLALNHGLNLARGKYIVRMDADDYSYPDRLEAQYSFLEQNKKYGLVSGIVHYMSDQTLNKGYKHHVNRLNTILNHKEIYNNRFIDAPVSHPSIIFRKSLVQKYGSYWDGDFPEDFELWNRWLSHGVRMTKINKPVIQWYDSDKRLSRIDRRYHEENFSKIKAKYFAQWFQRKYSNNQPALYIWGNGSAVKRKAKPLEKYNITIEKYIDIKRNNSSISIYYKDILDTEDVFILNYVSDRKGRKEIYNYLSKNGFVEGKNFYMMY